MLAEDGEDMMILDDLDEVVEKTDLFIDPADAA